MANGGHGIGWMWLALGKAMALSDADLKDLHSLFDLQDVNRTGRIDIKSAHHLAFSLGYDPHDEDAPG